MRGLKWSPEAPLLTGVLLDLQLLNMQDCTQPLRYGLNQFLNPLQDRLFHSCQVSIAMCYGPLYQRPFLDPKIQRH